MKKIAILAALAMAATTSFGEIYISWSAAAFQSGADKSKFATQDGVKLVWDLVYTSASSITAPTLDTKTGDIIYSSTDTVLSTRTWLDTDPSKLTVVDNTEEVPTSNTSDSPLTFNPNYAMITGGGSASYLNNNFTQSSGGIYSAVFQYMSDGTVYSALTDLKTGINWSNKDGLAGSDAVSFNMKQPTQIATELGKVTQVPEPATMSLLGLGALAMVIRRKLRK